MEKTLPAPISVVIPTLNAQSGLPEVSVALSDGLQAGLIAELVISDGGSSDATLEIAEELGARVVTGPASRGGQLLRGVAAAEGPWLLLLHADTVLDRGWTQAVENHLKLPGKAAYFRLRFQATGFWPWLVAGWANLRSRMFSLPYGDQGLLIHRDLLAQVGGIQDIPLMEDVALARALRGRLVMLPVMAATSAHKYQRDGWLSRSIKNGLTLTRYVLGTSPEKLAASYRRKVD
ncbi:MAG: TIGR04283 family arsenosugar biosynthesis glycosyltransferase [Pseudomonadota bacterium]